MGGVGIPDRLLMKFRTIQCHRASLPVVPPRSSGQNGGIVRSPITSKMFTIALEKVAFVIKAKPGANKVGVNV